jgi:hypothetical protein
MIIILVKIILFETHSCPTSLPLIINRLLACRIMHPDADTKLKILPPEFIIIYVDHSVIHVY